MIYIRKRIYFITSHMTRSKSLWALTTLLAFMTLLARPVNKLAAFLREN